jgi:hypothetical protein
MALQELPDIKDVTVTRTISRGDLKWNGTMEEAFHRICRYEIEFHDVLANLSGIRTLDKNPRTWTHVQTNFSFEAPVEGQREPYSADALRYASSDRGVTTIGDLPNLEVYETNGTSIRGLGATVVVTEVQRASHMIRVALWLWK